MIEYELIVGQNRQIIKCETVEEFEEIFLIISKNEEKEDTKISTYSYLWGNQPLIGDREV